MSYSSMNDRIVNIADSSHQVVAHAIIQVALSCTFMNEGCLRSLRVRGVRVCFPQVQFPALSGR